jgi:broad specificity phosphatase PhoE
MTDILLIRHGQSTFNAHYEETGEDPGHFDARLTALGREQAKATRALLADERVDLVITSPLTRAIETGLHIFGDRDIPFHITCRHRERLESSCDVGRSPEALKTEFPALEFDHLDAIWWHHEPAAKSPFVTEPLSAFEKRVRVFRDWIATHPAQRLAVIGHGTFFHALTGRWMQNCEVQRWEVSR